MRRAGPAGAGSIGGAHGRRENGRRRPIVGEQSFVVGDRLRAGDRLHESGRHEPGALFAGSAMRFTASARVAGSSDAVASLQFTPG